MLKRLWGSGRAQQPARDAYVEAAAVALEACAAFALPSDATRTPSKSSRDRRPSNNSVERLHDNDFGECTEHESASLGMLPRQILGAALGGDSFTQALRLILSAPIGQDRDALVDGELRKLLRNNLLVEGCAFLEEELLSFLRSSHVDEALADILANALTCGLAAFARDRSLESRAASAATSATTAAFVAHTPSGGATDEWQERLRRCQQVAHEAADLERGWESSLEGRQELVRQSLELLAKPQRHASQRAADASERKTQLQRSLEAAVSRASSGCSDSPKSDAAEQDGVLTLEQEMSRLEARLRQIRGELDTLSHQIVQQQELQRAHMAQEQQRSKDWQEARSTSSRYQYEVAKETSAMDMKQAECSTFLEAMQQTQLKFLEAVTSQEDEDKALLNSASVDVERCNEGLYNDADARLDACIVAGSRWLAERERATETLDLLGVELQDGERPLWKELPGVIRRLRVAWEERQSLSESQRQEEVELMLKKLAAEAGEDSLSKIKNPVDASPCASSVEATSKTRATARASPPTQLSVLDDGFALDAPSPLVSPCGGIPLTTPSEQSKIV